MEQLLNLWKSKYFGRTMSEINHSPGTLKQLSPDLIDQNPENPRIFFREDELNTLLESIRQYGIQVPITVYKDGLQYVLIDGERRWRCASKLNLKKIPALVQKKPTALENLLLMFNIHSLREQWDYFTIASKLPIVIDLYAEKNGREPNEIELSNITGLGRGQIRRCRHLLNLPERYKKILLSELVLPKSKQKLSEDFFIEMERSLSTIEKRLPETVSDLNNVRDALIQKFRSGIINNITDFRMLSKMATSLENIGTKEVAVRNSLQAIFDSGNEIGISAVYEEHFEMRYDQRKVGINVESVYEYLDWVWENDESERVSRELRQKLVSLRELIERILES